jgi:dihydrolipoamide dehydrogenase
MTARRTFDLAVVGSGPGGYRAAVLGALRGLKVAIVEQGVWGGTCLNRGCVPKKAWYASARLVAANRGFAARGLAGRLTPDLNQAWRHQRERRRGGARATSITSTRLGVTALNGRATAARRTGIDIGGRSISRCGDPRNRLRTYLPPALPLQGPRPHDRRAVRRAAAAGPARRDVGSGVIGTEMSAILAMLGREVTWLVQSEPLARIGFSARPARCWPKRSPSTASARAVPGRARVA